MGISDFYQTFFDEADELLADMEQHLLDLVPEAPDSEQLNAIFRVVHSIKGEAGTLGFTILRETTHLMENLLDEAWRGEMQLNADIINLFLETKDIMQEQLDAYKSSVEPDVDSFEYICQALRRLAPETKGETAPAVVNPAKLSVVDSVAMQEEAVVKPEPANEESKKRITLSRLKASEVDLLEEELGNLATLTDVVKESDTLSATLDGNLAEDDIIAVLCFVIRADQIEFETISAAPVAAEVEEVAVVAEPQPVTVAPAVKATASEAPYSRTEREKPTHVSESTSIRVAVGKADQLINLVGELVIAQSMLAQRSNELDPVNHGDLITSMGQLQRNARDL